MAIFDPFADGSAVEDTVAPANTTFDPFADGSAVEDAPVDFLGDQFETWMNRSLERNAASRRPSGNLVPIPDQQRDFQPPVAGAPSREPWPPVPGAGVLSPTEVAVQAQQPIGPPGVKEFDMFHSGALPPKHPNIPARIAQSAVSSYGNFAGSALRFMARIGMPGGNASAPVEDMTGIRQNLMSTADEIDREFASKEKFWADRSNRKNDDNFLINTLGQAGHMIPTLASGGLLAAPVTGLTLAGETRKEAIGLGASPEDADVSGIIPGLVGMGSEKLLGAPTRLLKGGLGGKTIERAMASSGAKEGVQEILEEGSKNIVINRMGIDPTRSPTKNLKEAGAAGLFLGALMGGGGHAASNIKPPAMPGVLPTNKASDDVMPRQTGGAAENALRANLIARMRNEGVENVAGAPNPIDLFVTPQQQAEVMAAFDARDAAKVNFEAELAKEEQTAREKAESDAAMDEVAAQNNEVAVLAAGKNASAKLAQMDEQEGLDQEGQTAKKLLDAQLALEPSPTVVANIENLLGMELLKFATADKSLAEDPSQERVPNPMTARQKKRRVTVLSRKEQRGTITENEKVTLADLKAGRDVQPATPNPKPATTVIPETISETPEAAKAAKAAKAAPKAPKAPKAQTEPEPTVEAAPETEKKSSQAQPAKAKSTKAKSPEEAAAIVVAEAKSLKEAIAKSKEAIAKSKEGTPISGKGKRQLDWSPAAIQRRRKAAHRRMEDQPADLIDWVAENYGSITPESIRKVDPNFSAVGAVSKLMRASGFDIDVVANGIKHGPDKFGLPDDVSSDQFFNALNAAGEARKAERAQKGQENRAIKIEEKQRNAFDKAQDDPALSDDYDLTDAEVGDEMTMKGEPVKVSKVEKDASGAVTSVTLDDGKVLGTQKVHVVQGKTVSADKDSIDSADPDWDVDDDNDLSLDIESVQDQKKRKAAEAHEATKKKRREAIADKAAKPLTGDPNKQESVDQGKFFEEDKDLFSQDEKSEETSKADAIRKLKIDTKGKMFDATAGLTITIFNLGVEAVALALEAGATVGDAIKKGIAAIRAAHPDQNIDEKAFTEELNKRIEFEKQRTSEEIAADPLAGEEHDFDKEARENITKKDITAYQRLRENVEFIMDGLDVSDPKSVKEAFVKLGRAAQDVGLMPIDTVGTFMRRIGRRNKGKAVTIDEMIDSLQPISGDGKQQGLGSLPTIDMMTGVMVNRYHKIRREFAEGILEKETAARQAEMRDEIGRLVTDQTAPLPNGMTGRFAKAVRVLNRQILEWMQSKGLDVSNAGEAHLTRQLSNGKMLEDPAGFREQVSKLFNFMNDGFNASDKKTDEEVAESVDYFVKKWEWMAKGYDPSVNPMQSNSAAEANSADFTKSRKFPKEADQFLNDFYERDIDAVMANYINNAVAQTVLWDFYSGVDPESGKIEKGTGNKKKIVHYGKVKQWRKRLAEDGVSKRDADQLMELFKLGITGFRGSDILGKAVTSAGTAMTIFSFMQYAPLSSIAEGFLVGTGTGSITKGVRAAGINLKRTITDYWNNGTDDDMRRLSEVLGSVQGKLLNIADSSMRMADTDLLGKKGNTLVDWFMRGTGLTSITNAARDAGNFINKQWMAEVGRNILGTEKRGVFKKKDGARDFDIDRLIEVDIPASRHIEFAKFMAKGEGILANEDVDLTDPDSMNSLVFRALQKMSRESSPRPNNATRAIRATKTPLGGLLYGLSSFQFDYGGAIQRAMNKRFGRFARSLKKGEKTRWDLMGAHAMLPFIVMLLAVTEEIRALLFGDSRIIEGRKGESLGKKGVRAASRAALLGRLDVYVNAFSGIKYQRDPATVLSGPLLGRMSQLFSMSATQYQDTVSGTAGNTNTNERRLGREALNVTVRPGTGLAGAAIHNAFSNSKPGKLLGTAMIALGGHPRLREFAVNKAFGKADAPGSSGTPSERRRAKMEARRAAFERKRGNR